jgi:hypothetical protein
MEGTFIKPERVGCGMPRIFAGEEELKVYQKRSAMTSTNSPCSVIQFSPGIILTTVLAFSLNLEKKNISKHFWVGS